MIRDSSSGTPKLLISTLELGFLCGGWTGIAQCLFFEIQSRIPRRCSGCSASTAEVHDAAPRLLGPGTVQLRLQRCDAAVCSGQLLAQAAAGLLRGQKVAGW